MTNSKAKGVAGSTNERAGVQDLVSKSEFECFAAEIQKKRDTLLKDN
jgi:hypothetical protein